MTQSEQGRQGERSSPRGPTEAELRRATPSVAGGREVRVGVFVLLGAVASLILLFILTDPAAFRGRYMIVTELEDAGGVRRGDPVQMRGVNVGRVRDFQIQPPGVAITLEVNGRWEIPVDSRARLGGTGIFGGRTVEIVRGDSADYLEDGDVIPGDVTDGLMELIDELGSDARVIVAQLRQLLSDSMVQHIQASAAGTESTLSALAELIDEQRSELSELTRALRTATGRADDLLADLDVTTILARADSSLLSVEAAGQTVDRTSRSLERILARIEAGEGTLGELTASDELHRNLNDAVLALLLLAEDVRENPLRYIRLRIF